MMYQDQLVVAIKVNGKVLREFKDTVYIPFGSEYSLFIKNLNSARVLVRVSIDGQDATDGASLVISGNESLDLERFIKAGNIAEGNRFKFIERTSKVEEYRGISAMDGLVRVEYEFERQPPYWRNPFRSADLNQPAWLVQTSSTYSTGSNVASSSINMVYDGCSQTEVDASVNDSGITVPGSISSQAFTRTSGFLTDGVKHVIVLKLLGEIEVTERRILSVDVSNISAEEAKRISNEVRKEVRKVKMPVTVKTKQKCTTCGHVNGVVAKFCSECGTRLTLG